MFDRKLTVEERYLRLKQLLDQMPQFAAHPRPTSDLLQWLGRAAAVVHDGGGQLAALKIEEIAQRFPEHPLDRENAAQRVAGILHVALARDELGVPPALTGSFIAAGSAHDAYAAVAKVLSSATKELLLIDPYAGDEALKYALAAPETVAVRVLADKTDVKSALKPASEAWIKQYGSSRPLEIRLAAPKSLHDRLILVDKSVAWSLGQSFNKLAERAHTSISRLEPEIANRKLSVYAAMWSSTTPL